MSGSPARATIPASALEPWSSAAEPAAESAEAMTRLRRERRVTRRVVAAGLLAATVGVALLAAVAGPALIGAGLMALGIGLTAIGERRLTRLSRAERRSPRGGFVGDEALWRWGWGSDFGAGNDLCGGSHFGGGDFGGGGDGGGGGC